MTGSDSDRTYLDFRELESKARYKLLCALVIPRPIAWVTTRSRAGVVNAAPFSFFNVFSEDPPLLVLGLQHREGPVLKDTTINIRETEEFVVNIVMESMFEDMVSCSAHMDSDTGEPGLLGMPMVEGRAVAVPYLADAPAAFECRLYRTLPVAPTRDIVIGEVVGLWARDGLVDPENHYVNWSGDLPLGRLFANGYSRTNEATDLRRQTPTVEAVYERIQGARAQEQAKAPERRTE